MQNINDSGDDSNDSHQENYGGYYVESIDEILRVDQCKMDFEKERQAIDIQKNVKQYKVNFKRQVPRNEFHPDYLPQREVHRYDNLTYQQLKTVWTPNFESKETVICNWTDKEGTQLLTITVEKNLNPLNQKQYILEFTLNLFQFYPNLNCISQLLRPSYQRKIPQLTKIFDSNRESHKKLVENRFPDKLYYNIAASPCEQHLIIRGLGKIAYFRLPRQKNLKDFFSETYNLDEEAHIQTDKDENDDEIDSEDEEERSTEVGLKVRKFQTKEGSKTFFLFHNDNFRMLYLCDETNKNFIEILKRERMYEEKDGIEVYPFGLDYIGFEWIDSSTNKFRFLIVKNYMQELSHDVFKYDDSVTMRGITYEEQSRIRTVNVLIQQGEEEYVFNLYRMTDQGLLLQETIPIEGKQITFMFLIKQYQNKFFFNQTYQQGAEEIRKIKVYQLNYNQTEMKSSLELIQEFSSETEIVIKDFSTFSPMNQIPNSTFLMNCFNNYQRFNYMSTLEFKGDIQPFNKCYDQESIGGLISEIAQQKDYNFLEVINDLGLVIFNTLEDSSTLYFLSPQNEYLLKIDNFDSYHGWRYQNQISEQNETKNNQSEQLPPYFKFYFQTKTNKLIILSVPNTELSKMIIDSIDLPNSASERKLIVSDDGLQFICFQSQNATSYSFKSDKNRWEKDDSTIISENQPSAEEILKSKNNLYSKYFESQQDLQKPEKQMLDQMFLSQTGIDDPENTDVIFLGWIVKYFNYRKSIYFIDRKSFQIRFILQCINYVVNVFVQKGDREEMLIEFWNEGIYKFNILYDIPGFIPRNLLVVENAVSVYNLAKRLEISYFENANKLQEYQCISTIKLKRDIADAKESIDFGQEQNDINKLISNIEMSNLSEILSYNITNRTHLIAEVKKMNQADQKKIFDILEKKFSFSSLDEIPYLTPDLSYRQNIWPQAFDKKSPFDIVLNLEHSGLVGAFLSSMIQQDKQGHLYTEICDKNVLKMAKLRIDLKPYFQSQLAFHLVSQEYYTNQKSLNPNTELIAMPQNYEKLSEIQQNINKLEGDLGNAQRSQSFLKRSFSMLKSQKELEKEQVEEFMIEHRILMLKETLQNSDGENKFLEILYSLSLNDQTILEIESIRAAIQFKWNNYARQFYIPHFFLIVTFIILFIFDQALINYNNVVKENLYQSNHKVQIVLRFSQLGILSYFMKYEFQQRRLGKQDVPIEDLCLFFTYLVFIIMTFTLNDFAYAPTYALKFVQCMVVIFTFVKLCLLIRIFTKLSFLITLLVQVFLGLKYFLFFFFLVIGAFALIVNIILKGQFKEYTSFNYIDVYILSLRQAIGDYDTANLTGETRFELLSWLCWGMIAIVGNIVFMNFIIAVVGQSYENCIGKMISEIERAKLTMIIDCERMFTDAERSDVKKFPKYILERRQADMAGEGTTGAETGQQWQGMVKELKIDNHKASESVKTEIALMKSKVSNGVGLIKTQVSQLQNDIDRVNLNMINQHGWVKNEMRELKANFKQEIATINNEIGEMKQEFKMNSKMLLQIIEKLNQSQNRI